MSRVRVSLAINPEQLAAYYQGLARSVQALSSDGRSVRFPAAILRPFVSAGGVRGTFEIEFDAQGKYKSIRRV
ncbi:MAG: hypothetical protein BWY87_00373 [Deltaproteobacteria bacterium ADurb.Bin510]|nr:MAG: hypothetical protein BWY87_00373 [Deltaproteobacteria bacterium ADurb.Bin510]